MRLHVAAKRYLAASEPGYLDLLSPASVQSLQLQGGPMSMQERARFAAERFAEEAVKLRRWDDEGKVVGMPTPGLDHFERYLNAALRS
ncbi:MAG: hypothetical protein HC861_02185 [Rhodospirillaceae bacterium]|nr:hypothetical protein [Rhodospirillaceae bacterium]